MGLTPDDDPFKPPNKPREVACLHCGKHYQSELIEWRIRRAADGAVMGFWCCPTPGCDGAGYEFDIYPVDKDGFAWFEKDDDEEDGDDLEDEEEDDDFDLALDDDDEDDAAGGNEDVPY